MKYAAIEGGGTTWVCAIAADEVDNFVERLVINTTDPTTTLGHVRSWLNSHSFDAIGIGAFGPIDSKSESPTFGFITSTPKPLWQNVNVLEMIGLYSEFRDVPFRFDTDVNAPALAEFDLHCQFASLTSCCYITVGTGIGVGMVVNGHSVKGLIHPEAGHIQAKRAPGDAFAGTCPYHGDCVEGMCSTVAIAARAGCSRAELPQLPDEEAVWELTAYYLAQLCVSVILVASPEVICIGGGVLNRTSLYPRIHKHVLSLLNGYISNQLLTPERIAEFIKPSHWGSKAGIVGAAYLAKLAAQDKGLLP